jgi:hypothetical protein
VFESEADLARKWMARVVSRVSAPVEAAGRAARIERNVIAIDELHEVSATGPARDWTVLVRRDDEDHVRPSSERSEGESPLRVRPSPRESLHAQFRASALQLDSRALDRRTVEIA